MLFGVDVSAHQGAIDWGAAKADGMTFAICRASLGAQVDPEYAGKSAGAARAGLVVGAYHYLWPGVDTKRSVDLFLDTVGETDGKLLMLDVESKGYGTNGEVYGAFRDWVREFRSRVPAHPLIIYTGGWFWRDRIGNPDGASYGVLAHSRYVSTTGLTVPAQWRTLWGRVNPAWWDPDYGRWPRATFLQFTSSAQVGSYSGRLDVNAFEGSRADLLVLTHDLPDTASGDETMQSFTTVKTPSVGTVAKGTWLYVSSDLTPDANNIQVDPGRDLPYFGTVDEARIVEYVDAKGAHSGRAMFVRQNELTNIRAVSTDDGIDQSDVDAAVAAQKEADAAAIAEALARADDAERRAGLAESQAETLSADLVAAQADLDIARAAVAASAADVDALAVAREAYADLDRVLGT